VQFGDKPGRLGAIEQLALYSVFHRGVANRAIHNATVPIIIASGMLLAVPLSAALHIDLGLVVVAGSAGAFALLDAGGALALAAWTFPALWLASALASRLTLPALLVVGLPIQAVAWFVTVQIGHERLEPTLLAAATPGAAPAPVSTNLYFDRGYFVLRNVGRPVTFLEAYQQFAIGPFALSLDLLFALGYRASLRAQIEARIAVYVGRLARGEAILGADSAPLPGSVSPSAFEGADPAE